MRSRTLLVGSILALAAVLAVGGLTRLTSASFTADLTTGGSSFTNRAANVGTSSGPIARLTMCESQ